MTMEVGLSVVEAHLPHIEALIGLLVLLHLLLPGVIELGSGSLEVLFQVGVGGAGCGEAGNESERGIGKPFHHQTTL